MAQQPHILLITSDQHRADSLGCAGHPVVRTPHLDLLARQGVHFTNATSECPACIPARTALISGIHPQSYGMPSYEASFRLERFREDLLGGLLTRAGYQTALVGKRHWHRDPSCTGGFEHVVPIERCKREQSLHTGGWGFPTGMGGCESHPSMTDLPRHLYSSDWIVNRSLEILHERDTTRPLFLWASFVDPHPPLAIHEPYYSMYRHHTAIPEPLQAPWNDAEDAPLPYRRHRAGWGNRMGPDEIRDARAVYYGMITNMDHQLGRLLGMLDRLNMLNNTLVLYTSDHGDMLGDHGDEGKSSFYRSASDIPMILRPPMSTPLSASTSSAPVGLCDVLPTLAEFAGIDSPEGVEGISMASQLDGTTPFGRDHLFGSIDGTYLASGREHRYQYNALDGSEQLFSVEDRDQVTPLPITDAPHLKKALTQWLEERGSNDVEGGELIHHGHTWTEEKSRKVVHGLGGHAGRFLGFDGPV